MVIFLSNHGNFVGAFFVIKAQPRILKSRPLLTSPITPLNSLVIDLIFFSCHHSQQRHKHDTSKQSKYIGSLSFPVTIFKSSRVQNSLTLCSPTCATHTHRPNWTQFLLEKRLAGGRNGAVDVCVYNYDPDGNHVQATLHSCNCFSK